MGNLTGNNTNRRSARTNLQYVIVPPLNSTVAHLLSFSDIGEVAVQSQLDRIRHHPPQQQSV